MAHPQPATKANEVPFVDEDYVDPTVEAHIQADADAALEFLCAHADEWPGGRGVASRIRRHRRRIAPTAARRAG